MNNLWHRYFHPSAAERGHPRPDPDCRRPGPHRAARVPAVTALVLTAILQVDVLAQQPQHFRLAEKTGADPAVIDRHLVPVEHGQRPDTEESPAGTPSCPLPHAAPGQARVSDGAGSVCPVPFGPANGVPTPICPDLVPRATAPHALPAPAAPRSPPPPPAESRSPLPDPRAALASAAVPFNPAPPQGVLRAPSRMAASSLGDFFGGALARSSRLAGPLVTQGVGIRIIEPSQPLDPVVIHVDSAGNDTSASFLPGELPLMPTVIDPTGNEVTSHFQNLNTNAKPAVITQQAFVQLSAGGQPLLGLDTNGDGLLDTFPNLVQLDNIVNKQFIDPGRFIAVDTGKELAVANPNQGTIVFDGKTFRVESNSIARVFDIRQQFDLNLPEPGTGRLKIAENNSPIPRDRVFLNYSYFDDVRLGRDSIDVKRIVPGLERTFFDERMSLTVQLPFASTLNSDITLDGATDGRTTEFGNVNLVLKAVLHETPRCLWSGGLQVALPTADDVHVRLSDGTELVRLENEAVHLLPYLAAACRHSERFFSLWYAQADFDVNGNPVLLNDLAGTLQPLGRNKELPFFYADVTLGYWLYRDRPLVLEETTPHGNFVHVQSTGGLGYLTGIAPMLEFHYNRSLDDADVIQRGPFRIGNFRDNIEILNVVAGLTLEFFNSATLTAGYVAPIDIGGDQEFDWEFRLMFNWFMM